MSKFIGILIGLGIAGLGAWQFDSTSSKVCWAVAVTLLVLLLAVVKRGAGRVPALRLGFTVVLVVSAFSSTLFGSDRPQLGLDLQGGVSIVLFPVDGSELSQLDTAVNIISNRINGLGVAEPEVSRQGNTIVVDIPGLKDPERAVEVVGRTACLRFRVVTGGPVPVGATVAPTTTPPSTTLPSTTSTTSTSASPTTSGGSTSVPSTSGPSTTPTATTGPTESSAQAAGRTISTLPVAAVRPRQESTTSAAPATSPTTTAPGPTTTTVPAPKLNCDVSPNLAPPPGIPNIPDLSVPTDPSAPAVSPTPSTPSTPTAPTVPATESSAEAAGRTISTTPVAAIRPAQESTSTSAAITTVAPSSSSAADATTTTIAAPTTTSLPVGTNICETLVGPDDPDGSAWLYNQDKTSCYQVGPTLLTGRAIKDADSRFEQEWLVSVEFRDDGFVTNVATPYVGQQVAIVLDDLVQSAPTINEGITGRDVQISGEFKEKEADDLALVLKYGSLPVQFDESETTRQSVSPSLGKDQLSAGIAAGAIGLALVALYMVLYYRLLGLVVWLGLGLTGFIFFTIVSFLGNSSGLTLTLAGVTGLIVSVGVTVDSYVVYFERLKDEVRSGKTIRSSLDVGFKKAFRTIVAADLVSLIGAGVLYLLAIGSVKGFAFFLGLSTLIDLTIAYFFMYPMVWFLARRPSLVRMRGLGIASGLDVAGKLDV